MTPRGRARARPGAARVAAFHRRVSTSVALGWAMGLSLGACGSGASSTAEEDRGVTPSAQAPVAEPEPPTPAAAVVRAPRMDGDVVLVDVGEVREKLAERAPLVLIDARPVEDFEHEHIPGAINVPLRSLAAASELPGVPRDYEIVVYCIAPECPISKNAARVLAGLGYVNVKDMRAGLVGWKRAGYETVSGGGA